MKVDSGKFDARTNLKYCKIIDGKYTGLILKEFLSYNNQQILDHDIPVISELFEMRPSQVSEPFVFSFGCALINVYDLTKNIELLDELRFLSANFQQQTTYQYASVLHRGSLQNQDEQVFKQLEIDEHCSNGLNEDSLTMNQTIQRLSKMVAQRTREINSKDSMLRSKVSVHDKMKQKQTERQ